METRTKRRRIHDQRVALVRSEYKGLTVLRSASLVHAVLTFLNGNDWRRVACVTSNFRNALKAEDGKLWRQEAKRLQDLADKLHKMYFGRNKYVVSTEPRDLVLQLSMPKEAGTCKHCTEVIMPLHCAHCLGPHSKHSKSKDPKLLDTWEIAALFGGTLCYECRMLPQYKVHGHQYYNPGHDISACKIYPCGGVEDNAAVYHHGYERMTKGNVFQEHYFKCPMLEGATCQLCQLSAQTGAAASTSNNSSSSSKVL